MEKVGLVWFTALPSYCHHGNQAVSEAMLENWRLHQEKLGLRYQQERLRRMRVGEEIYLSSIPSNT
jgi:hypothetical protein